MPTDAERVADLLRADLLRTDLAADTGAEPAMASLYADSVELRHTPPLPTDAPLSGAFLRDVSIAETAAARRALPDLARDENSVTVDGNSIRLQSTVTGTLATTGESIKVHTDVVVEVRDGRIVAMEARLGADAMATWGTVLAAGGFEIPTVSREAP